MHSYDLEGRGKVYTALAVASLPPVWLLDVLMNAANFSPQWWVSAPSFATFYVCLHWMFDRYVWRLGLLRRLGLVGAPNLGGEWVGSVESSYSKDEASRDISVSIAQRWSKMSITSETEHSQSRSVVASVGDDGGAPPELTYMYVNEPNPRAVATMNTHRGTAVLRLRGQVLEGDYYSGRGRQTIGSIKLHRVKGG